MPIFPKRQLSGAEGRAAGQSAPEALPNPRPVGSGVAAARNSPPSPARSRANSTTALLAMAFISVVLAILFSTSSLSLTGHISERLYLFFSPDDFTRTQLYLITGSIDSVFYFIILYAFTRAGYLALFDQSRFRELTRSEARYARLSIPGEAVARRTVTSSSRPKVVDKSELIADNLNTRVSSLQARSTMIYWTILFTLAIGVTIVIFSGHLSSLDTAGSQLWSRIDTELNRLNSTDGEAVSKFNQHYEEVLKAAVADLSTTNSKGRVWNWPSTILRVSVAGLLIFLVQILIQLYRYNSLLIAFYSSRRDAIIMSEGNFQTAKNWTALFFPANLTFGREPRHPFQAVSNPDHS
jgi:hypothetical protein